MNSESIAKPESDSSEIPQPPAARVEETTNSNELPFYIVPEPPIPGKTSWSIAP